MAFLDYLLGGVSGGFEGYERKKARELQAQKDEEERQFRRLTLLPQLDFRPTGLVDQGAAPGARNIVADISANLPKPISDTKIGSAFEAARQRGFGIEPPPASPLTSPVSLALDTTKGRQPEQPPRMPQTGPEIQVNTPFGRMGFTRETEDQKLDRELKKFEAQQDLIEKRTAAANDRANRGYFAILKKAGRLPGVEYDDVKDIDLKSSYDELKQERSLTSAMQRAQIPAQYGSYLTGVVGPDGQPQIMFGTRRGSITPTGIGAVTPSKMSKKAEEIAGTTAPVTDDDLAYLDEFIPIPKRNAQGKIVSFDPPKRSLSPAAGFLATAGGFGGAAGEAAYAAAGPDAQRLSTIINPVADRKALREQPGRLSDRDVINKRNEVNIRGGDVGNLASTYNKLSKVRAWALEDRTSSKAQGADTEPDAVYQAALDAIRQGRDRTTVIQRYEQGTGKKWPGGR